MTAAKRTPFRLSLTSPAAAQNVFHDYVVRTGSLWEISLIVCEFGVQNANNLANIVHDTNTLSLNNDTTAQTAPHLVDASAFPADEWLSYIATLEASPFEYLTILSNTVTNLVGANWVPDADPADAGAYRLWNPIFDEYNNFIRATFDPRAILGRPIILETTKTLRVIFGRGTSSTVTSTIYGLESPDLPR